MPSRAGGHVEHCAVGGWEAGGERGAEAACRAGTRALRGQACVQGDRKAVSGTEEMPVTASAKSLTPETAAS